MHSFLKPGIALLLGLEMSACSHGPVAPIATIDLPWTPFWWVGGTLGEYRFDKMSIVVRSIESPEQVLWHQLDLGGSGAMPDGFPATRQTPTAAPRLPGQLYGLLGSAARLEFFPPLPDSLRDTWGHREVGTLGLPLYLTTALVIDFPHERIAEIPAPKDITSLLGPKGTTVSIEGGYERVLLKMGGRDGQSYVTLLDTGLSPFPLWTTRAVWRQLTGLADPASGGHRYVLSNPRWGLVFLGAPLKSELRIGTWRVPSVEVVYLAEGPVGAALEDWNPPVEAVLGPSLFARDAILVLDLPHRRLGLGRTRR